MMITMSIRLRFAGLGEAGVGTDVNLCSELVSVLAMMLLLKQLNSEQFLMPRSNQGCGLACWLPNNKYPPLLFVLFQEEGGGGSTFL